MEVLEFLIPNEWGSQLKDIFMNIDVEIYDWVIGENTEILGEGNESIFDTLTMSGRDFLENINLPNYYVIHALFLAYPKGSLFEPINDFDDFFRSDCKIALIIIDCTDVDLYAKDSAIIQQVMINAMKLEYTKIQTFNDIIEMKKYFQPLL